MPGDRFDRLCACGLVLVAGALAILLGTAGPSAGQRTDSGLDRKVEQAMLSQARIAFLERHYGSVVAMRDRGELQSALLKLEELEQELPGEPHGALLRGEILHRMGSLDRAVGSLAQAVRGNGDYVDQVSPLNRRELIARVVEQGIPLLRDRLRGQPEDRQAEQTLKAAYYLQSRLAGGCE